MTSLEDSLALQSAAPGEWRLGADPTREANTGMFGGWTAAVLLKSVLAHDGAQGEPVSLTVNYINRIVPGADLKATSARLGGGRSLTTWRAEIAALDDAAPAATAAIVMANRRDSDAFTEMSAPDAPAPETLAITHPPAPFGETIDMRAVSGFPPFNRQDTRSVCWLRETSGRTVDAVGIAYLADCFPPRIYFIGAEPRPSSTITMSIYFHATAADFAALGDDFILSDAVGVRASKSTVASRLDLWSRQGALLATSEQLCWFR